MHHELAIDFGVGLENGVRGAGDLAFRCGLSFRGDERPIRDAGSSARVPATMMAGALIAVPWSPPVSWRKRILFPKR